MLLRVAIAAAGLAAVVSGPVAGAAGQSQTGARIVEINGDHKDGTATFRIDAPQAKDVRVMLNTMSQADAKPMWRDADGIWNGSLGPLVPDYYPVAFITDGMFRTAGYVHVTGPTPEAWDPRPVPHGTIHQHWYDSQTLGMLRAVWVYTPPGYETGTASYPVLYLLHGSGGDETSWVTDGLTNIIMDNLIADGTAMPMIVVMPFGHTEPSPRAGVVPSYAGRDTAGFTRELIDEIVPAIEKTYRVTRGADARAIAGFSMGGNHARLIGLGRMDVFHWVGTFSGTLGGGRGAAATEAMQQAYAGLFEDADATNATLKLLWMAVGSEETRLLDQHKVFTGLLNEHRIRHTFVVEPGGHTYYVWRRNLRDLARLLFR